MRRRRGRRDGGFALTELLIVLAVLGIVGTIVASATIQSFGVTRRGQDRVVALGDLQKGLERIAREVRVARSVYVDNAGHGDSCLAVVVERDSKTYYFIYRLDDPATVEGRQALVEDRQVFDGLGVDPATATEDDKLEQHLGLFIDRIANYVGETEAIFNYYDVHGTHLDPTDPSKLLTAAQIEITLKKQLTEEREPLRASTRVNVRAARFSEGTVAEQQCY